jgi:hypothetical protein
LVQKEASKFCWELLTCNFVAQIIFAKMAEQEVIKHTKKVYKVWNKKQTSFWHKVKEFLIEIFIIVFAITISIWFHNLSEKRHNRTEVKSFLSGLRTDIEKDAAELQEDSLSYEEQRHFFKYLVNSEPLEMLDTALMKSESWTLRNSTFLVPNISRFEAMKYSGLMEKITNKELLNEILNLYEEDIPKVVTQGKSVTAFKEKKIWPLLDKIYFQDHKDAAALKQLLNTDKEFNFAVRSVIGPMNWTLSLYKQVISQYRKVDSLIVEDLKN